jgi:hypothetical protein
MSLDHVSGHAGARYARERARSFVPYPVFFQLHRGQCMRPSLRHTASAPMQAQRGTARTPHRHLAGTAQAHRNRNVTIFVTFRRHFLTRCVGFLATHTEPSGAPHRPGNAALFFSRPNSLTLRRKFNCIIRELALLARCLHYSRRVETVSSRKVPGTRQGQGAGRLRLRDPQTKPQDGYDLERASPGASTQPDIRKA